MFFIEPGQKPLELPPYTVKDVRYALAYLRYQIGCALTDTQHFRPGQVDQYERMLDAVEYKVIAQNLIRHALNGILDPNIPYYADRFRGLVAAMN